MGNITQQQEAFVLKYTECGNASEAYRCAYPRSRGWKDKSVWEKSSVMLNNVKVQSRVRELQEVVAKRSEITKEQVLAEVQKVAFSSIAYMHNTWIERREFDQLTDAQKSSIKSIQTRTSKKRVPLGGGKFDEVEVEQVKIELYDKLKALEIINKMLGYDAPQKVDVNVSGTLSDERFIELMEKSK